MKKLLDKIKLPQGLRSLSFRELDKLAAELRTELIDCVSMSGGHLASSLGVTELTIALHYAFNTPFDRIVWDVGHQAYIHKMLTERRDKMKTIRHKNGISGFLRRDESPYDAFGAGHAGTSISAALGMALGLEKEHPDRSVVAVLGDGAMTCGLTFEALNQAGDVRPNNLIVVLNDNEMSISPNVGAISRLFSMAVTSHVPTKARSKFKNLYRRGYIPELIYKIFDRAEEVTQGFISGPSMLFESLGFRYIGPVDGHDIKALVKAFTQAKKQNEPVLIHAVTTKGKGYKPAEINPTAWHGVKPFCKEKGEFIKLPTRQVGIPTYTSVFSDTLVKLAHQMPEIVAITAAMPSGTGLDHFQETFPDRFYDVGICESHAVTFAAGLACEGKHPICAIYSTFLQRAYDQILHDVCIQKLPVVFAIDRAGMVGDDGETHQGLFDVSFMRSMPNITIMAPKDENELQHALYTAFKLNTPVAIRYPRGLARGVTMDAKMHLLPLGKSELIKHGQDVLLIALGNMVQYAEEAAEILLQHGISTTIINTRFAKPLDEALLLSEIAQHKLTCTIEDQMLAGGFGSAVLELAADATLQCPIKRFGVGDHFVPHASTKEQHILNHYDPASIANFVCTILQSHTHEQQITKKAV